MTDKKPSQKNNKDKKSQTSILLRLGKYVFKYWPLFLAAIIFTLVSNHLALLGPSYSGDAIDAVAHPDGVQFDAVWSNVCKMLACYVISAILSYGLAVIMIHLSQKIVYTMRKQLFEKLNTLPVTYFDTNAAGDIVSRIS